MVMLISCGGGGDSGGSGGGGGGGGSGSLTFTLDRNSLDFTFEESTTPPIQTVTATATGNFSGTLYIGAIAEGQGIDPTIVAIINGMQGTFQIRPRADLVAGQYSGRVLLLACSDPQCNNRIGNTPLPVSYTVRIDPTLKLSAYEVALNAVSGNETSTQIGVQLPIGVTEPIVTVVTNPAAFSVADITATGFRIVGRSVPSLDNTFNGIYSGIIRVVAGTRERTIVVNYTVTPSAGGQYFMTAAPTSLTLNTTEGARSAPVRINVTPATWNVSYGYSSRIDYLNAARDWLSVAQINGGLELVANAEKLPTGTYSARLWVTGDPYSNDIPISVALTVGVGLIRPADVTVPVTSETTLPQLSGSVPITVAGGSAVNWTASSSKPWLVLTRAAGTTGTNLTYSVDVNALNELANGTVHETEITIIPEPATMSSVTFTLQVDKRLAQVIGLGPYLQLSDRPLRIIARGLGFNGINDLSARIVVEGVSGLTIQRRSDNEVLITAGPQVAGTYRVRATNALNLNAAERTTTVIDPKTQLAASVTTGGDGESLIYDAEHNVAYFANTSLSAVQRFAPVGPNWQMSTAVPVPALSSIGLSNDGTNLITLSSVGDTFSSSTVTLRFLQTNDSGLAQRAQFDRSGSGGLDGSSSTGANSLPVTNDGRIWFRGSSSGLDSYGPVYFDPLRQTFDRTESSFPNSFIGSLYFTARDGSRLLVTPNRCCTPRPPVLYMDADYVLHQNPAGLAQWTWIHGSDDGDRVLFDAYNVYDRNFAFIGDTTHLGDQEPGWRSVGGSGLVSPDGNRTYLLVYHSSEVYLPNPTPPSPTLYPRVYVFDSSTRMTNTTQLPLLGYFTLTDYPITRSQQGSTGRTGSAISPDGRTLFFAGNAKFMVVPIPDESTLSAPISVNQTSRPAAQIGSGATTPWRLNLQ
jgi:hypothetical protein